LEGVYRRKRISEREKTLQQKRKNAPLRARLRKQRGKESDVQLAKKKRSSRSLERQGEYLRGSYRGGHVQGTSTGLKRGGISGKEETLPLRRKRKVLQEENISPSR